MMQLERRVRRQGSLGDGDSLHRRVAVGTDMRLQMFSTD